MPKACKYSNPENYAKLKNFLTQPKTLPEIMRKFNIPVQGQGKNFITAATYMINIYEYKKDGKTFYAILK